MRRLNAIRASVVTGVVGLLVLAGAVPALASLHTGSATTKTKDIVIAKNDTGGGKLSCPSGQRVTAGGVRWLPDGHSTGLPLISQRRIGASIPVDGGRGWYANGYNADPATSSVTMRIIITCLPAGAVGTYSVKAAWLTPATPSGAVKTTVSCGTGQRVVTGGAAWRVPGAAFDDGSAANHTIISNTPKLDAKGWFGAGFSQTTSAAQLRVVALCRPSSSVGSYSTRTKVLLPKGVIISFVTVLAGGSLSCPTGQRVVSGGAFWRLTISGGNALDGVISASAPNGKTGWYAAGAPGNSGVDRVLVLVVHCRPL